MSNDDVVQTIWSTISDFMYEEEANIDRKKIISVGALLAIATFFLSSEAWAKHASHASHRSHSSHSSHSSGSGTHSNHYSHNSHNSHNSHTSSTYSHASHASSTSTSIIGSYGGSISGTTAVTHSNSGVAVSNSATSGNVVVASPDSVPDPSGVIDIRIPKTPPDSPLMKGVENCE